MKITITDLDGRVTVLGDDSKGEYIDGLAPEQVRGSQEARRDGADHAEYFGRGNRSNTWSWSVDREHKDKRTALAFAMDHAERVPVEGVLRFIEPDGATRTVENAIVTSVRFDPITGRSTRCHYAAQGGMVS